MIGPYFTGDTPADPVDIYITREGEDVDLSEYSGARIELESPDGSIVNTETVNVVLAADRVIVSWPSDTSLFVMPGVYTMQILLQSGESEQRISVIPFEVKSVVDLATTVWATPSDVAMLTGLTVEPSTIVQAQGIVEMYSGYEYGDERLKDRDLRHLRKAVAYQASFIASNDQLFSRAGVASFSQDGAAFSAGNQNGEPMTDAFVLAPLARRALQAMARTGDKTIRVGGRRRRGSLHQLEDAWVRDLAGLTIWQPLGTVGRFPGGTTERGI